MAFPRPFADHFARPDRDVGRRPASATLHAAAVCTALWLAAAACGGTQPVAPTSVPASDAKASPATTPTSAATTSDTGATLPAGGVLYGVASDVSWYTDATYRTATLTKAKELNAKVARVGLFWMWVEYSRGKRDWSVPDHVINSLTASGIKPLLTVMGSPQWASGVQERKNEYFYLYVPADSAAFRRWVASYTDFITAAAQRYKGKVTMWELGNEMNDAWFWRPKPDVAQYATWFQSLRSAIKTVDPAAVVASGGMNGLADNLAAPSLGARAFLAGLYARNVFPEAVAIHPYASQGQSPDVHLAQSQVSNFDDITLIHDFLAANGQGNRPLWITEWGWSVDKVTPEQQADYVTKSLNLIETTYSSYVKVATYYSEFDPSTTYHYGLYTKDLSPRPAADAFKHFMTGR